MRIGIVSTWFERGAAYVSRQYMQLLSRKHKVFIYARGGEIYGKGDPEWDKPFVTWGTCVNRRSTDIDIDNFTNWIKNNKIDVIFFNEQTYYEPIICARNLGVKVGAYIDYYKKDTISCFAIYDFIICNTKRHYSVFKDFNQCYYVPWGTDIELFKPQSKSSEQFIFFMSVGYAPRRKGADVAIKALGMIDEKYDCQLIIHSQVDLASALPECRDLINTLTIKKRLKIICKTETAPGLYHLGDVYIYPSWLDGIGLSLTEAVACGVPVITTNTPPMNEIGEEDFVEYIDVDKYIAREDGYYWPLSIVNVISLRDKMLKFLKCNTIDILKENARKYAEKELDWNKNENIVNEIFENSIILDVSNEIIKEARKLDNKGLNSAYKYIQIANNVKRINDKLKTISGNLAIYGNGEHTKMLFELTEIGKYDIQFIIDKNHWINENYNVIDVNSINDFKIDNIIISSYKWQKDMISKLVDDLKYSGNIICIYDESDNGEFYL